LTYALVEIGDEAGLLRGLTSANARVERAAIVALDQLGSRRLEVSAVLSRMNHRDAGLRDAARWIAGRHPEWSGELTGFLRGQLEANLDDAQQAELVELLARFGKAEVIQRLLAGAVRDAGKSPAAGRVALRAMAKAGLKEVPASWVSSLADSAVHDSPVLGDVLATARAVTVPKQGVDPFRAALMRLADSEHVPPADRLTALAAVPGGASAVSPAQWALLLAHLDRDQLVKLRGAAADVLSQAKLTRDQLLQLAERLPSVGPLEIDRVLNAFAQSGDEAVGSKLLAALGTPTVRPHLRVDGVQQRLKKHNAAVQKEAEKLYALINADFAQQQSRLNEVAASLPPGDIRRGQAIFNSAKTSCLACHNIGYVGGRIGPDLTRIGGIRTQRDLLESILFPSASFVRSYESLAVLTTDGRTFNGIAKVDSAEEIVLIEAADKEVRIARGDVEAVQPGKISIMPAGLDKQLSPQELADLVAFLQACR
jgi:putative heme-binding domain-containing protein